MILSIHQPCYFPWLGLLHKLACSDTYLVMDEVQLTDSGYQHRNLFLTADGKIKYLTIPFNKAGYMRRSFRELEITDTSWRERHMNFLVNSYRRCPGFEEVYPALSTYYAAEYPLLIDAVMASIRLSLQWFGLEPRVVLQSEIPHDRRLRRGELVLALIAASGATCYLSGTGARAYQDERAIRGLVTLSYSTFSHPTYLQRQTKSFVPGLSCLDVLFHLGVGGARDLLAELRHA